jgi:site-specific DNA recombinase
MAYNRQFDILVVREVDRLARNRFKHIVIENDLAKCGIRVEYAIGQFEDTPEGRLFKGMVADYAEFEREKICERMSRGRRNKIKNGSVIVRHTAPPYGYRVINENDRQILEIDETEAEIVRLIFRWYTIGDGESGPMGLRKIANKLTETGVPTPTDNGRRNAFKKRQPGQWSHLTIWGIITKTTYIGRWQYADLAVDVPAIVDLATWELAQAQLKQNKQSGDGNRKHNYLLAGRCTCGKCNAKMETTTGASRGRVYQYYRCPATWKNNRAYLCKMPYFRVDRVDQAVWDWVVDITSDPKYLKAKLIEYQQHQDEVNGTIRRELSTIDDLLSQNHSRRKRWLEMYEAGIVELDELKEKQVEYDKTINGLEGRRDELREKLQDELTDETIEDLVEFARVVREELIIVGKDFAKRRRWIEMMDVQVRLTIEDGKRIAYASARMGKQRVEKRLPVASTSIWRSLPRTRPNF